MSLHLINNKLIATPNSDFWSGQSLASWSGFLRVNSRADAADVSGLVRHGLGHWRLSVRANTSTGGVTFLWTLYNAAGASATGQTELGIGTTYHLAGTHAGGRQILYVQGYPTTFAALAGTTLVNAGVPVQIGSTVTAALDAEFDRFAAWHGVELTAGQVAALRDGADPATIGGATKRFYWTLAGLPGATPVAGDPGLAEVNGDAAKFAPVVGGTGTIVYSDPLEFHAAVRAKPRVCTSGKVLSFEFVTIADGAFTQPIGLLDAPSVVINGVDVGQVVNVQSNGVHQRVLGCVPPGYQIQPGDDVRVNAGNGWYLTQGGVALRLDGEIAENCAGRSAVGTDELPRTLRMGVNYSAIGTANWTTWHLFANRARIISQFSNVTATDTDGKPTALSATTAVANLILPPGANQIDASGTPYLEGYYAIGWDDPLATLDFEMLSANLQVICSEVLGLRNFGSGGIGQVKVYWIRYANLAVTTNWSWQVQIKMTCPSKAPRFDNLIAYGPGDFNFVEGVPVVLDRADPLRLNCELKDRLQSGIGSERMMDTTGGFGGKSAIAEPEQLKRMTDFAWGNGFPRLPGKVGFTQARPFDSSVSPWVYSDWDGLGGQPYTCTLAAPINATQTTCTISDAATAPVLVGLKIRFASGETVRVMDVNGTTVTIDRAADGTTAAAQTAGPAQVRYRIPVSESLFQAGWRVFELVSSAPHKLRTGQAIPLSTGWPVFAWDNGSEIRLNNYERPALVTGANSYFSLFTGGSSGTWNNLSTTYTLDPNTQYVDTTWPRNDGFPFEVPGLAASRFPDCELFLNIPSAASDALVRDIARKAKATYPPDRLLWLEHSNEPWNWAFWQSNLNLFISGLFLPTAPTLKAWNVLRLKQIYDIFREVFGDRAGQLRTLYNSQQGDTGTIDRVFQYARQIGLPIHTIAVAPYLQVNRYLTENLTMYHRLDNQQAIDYFVHDVYYNTRSDGYLKMCQAVKARVDQYAADTGVPCVMTAYEGGSDCAMPIWRSKLSAAIDDAQTTLPVAATNGMIVGQWLVLEATTVKKEWVVVQEILSATSVRVTRGQGGTAAVAHAKDVDLRTTMVERNRDIMNDPLYYVAETDFYAFFQRMGFVRFNLFNLAANQAEISIWPLYSAHGQIHGRGAGGQAGVIQNNLYVCEPGKANTKAESWNIARYNASVRGQALIDWNAAFAELAPVQTSNATPRSRPPRLPALPRYTER